MILKARAKENQPNERVFSMRIQAKWSVLLVAGLYAASCVQSAKKRNIKDIIETPESSLESSSFQSLAKELRLASGRSI